jgi:hypothetical protein
MWCLWREMNACSFEDRELGIVELKKRVLQTLFSWRVLWHSSQVSTLAEFIDLCVFFKLKASFAGSFCILPVYMGCAPCAFNKLLFTDKKKKKLQKGSCLVSFSSIPLSFFVI